MASAYRPKRKIWFEGGGTWVYAFLYNNVTHDQKYLDVAERSLKLVERTRPSDRNEFWHKALNREGAALGSPDTEIYRDMFIAEGMTKFSRRHRRPPVLGRSTGNRERYFCRVIKRARRVRFAPA
jgi:hypothetical protein